jgi:uncharacterized LabA/DUF88 family protein
MTQITIFVDGAAMVHAQKLNKWYIDWKKVLDYFTLNRECIGAYYFTPSPAISDVGAVTKYRRFKAFLVSIGYRVIDKEVKLIRSPETGNVVMAKGSLDMEMGLTMISEAPHYDSAIIFTGDSDFLPVVERLKTQGKQVYCVSHTKMTSFELRNACTKYFDLESLRANIERIL